MCIQFLRMDLSKGSLFFAFFFSFLPFLVVGMSQQDKGIFFFAPPRGPDSAGRWVGCITGSGEWGGATEVLATFLCSWVYCRFWCLREKEKLSSSRLMCWFSWLYCTSIKALAYFFTGWSPYQCNLSRAQRTMVTSRYCS